MPVRKVLVEGVLRAHVIAQRGRSRLARHAAEERAHWLARSSSENTRHTPQADEPFKSARIDHLEELVIASDERGFSFECGQETPLVTKRPSGRETIFLIGEVPTLRTEVNCYSDLTVRCFIANNQHRHQAFYLLWNQLR